MAEAFLPEGYINVIEVLPIQVDSLRGKAGHCIGEVQRRDWLEAEDLRHQRLAVGGGGDVNAAGEWRTAL